MPGLRQERCRGDFHFEPGSALPMFKGQGHPAHQAPNPYRQQNLPKRQPNNSDSIYVVLR
ncbi:hypothetical protein ACVWZV_008984 [Bradyrhizobium sp. GM5.1]